MIPGTSNVALTFPLEVTVAVFTNISGITSSSVSYALSTIQGATDACSTRDLGADTDLGLGYATGCCCMMGIGGRIDNDHGESEGSPT